MNIIELINKYNSDKGYAHGYSNIYHRYFESLRDSKLTMLEVGIGTGESVNVWYDFFGNSTIYMADIDDYSHLYNKDRLKCLTVDQSDRLSLENLRETVGQLSIVLDDGGHAMHHQQLTLGIMFKNLNSNGLYFIEDLHTSTWEPGSTLYNQDLKISEDRKTTTLNVLTQFQSTGVFQSPFLSVEENGYLTECIRSIDFFCNNKLCLLVKK